jgi:hypothetical protein
MLEQMARENAKRFAPSISAIISDATTSAIPRRLHQARLWPAVRGEIAQRTFTVH